MKPEEKPEEPQKDDPEAQPGQTTDNNPEVKPEDTEGDNSGETTTVNYEITENFFTSDVKFSITDTILSFYQNEKDNTKHWCGDINIAPELNDNKITLEDGDSVLVTLSGTFSTKIEELYGSVTGFKDDGTVEYFYDKHTTSISMGKFYTEGNKFTLRIPMNFITTPGLLNDKGANIIQLVCVAPNEQSLQLLDYSMTVDIYKSKGKVLNFGKDIDYANNGQGYRDNYVLKFADNEDSITKSIVKLTQNDTVSITIKGISNKDVTLTCLVVDGSLK